MALSPTIHVKDGKVTGAYASQAKNVSYNSSNVEAALDSIMPRTATGTTLAQLEQAIVKLSLEQKLRCVIEINEVYALRCAVRTSTASATFDAFNAFIMVGTTSNSAYEFRLDTTNSTFKRYIGGDSGGTSITVTSWTIYYQGTPISW